MKNILNLIGKELVKARQEAKIVETIRCGKEIFNELGVIFVKCSKVYSTPFGYEKDSMNLEGQEFFLDSALGNREILLSFDNGENRRVEFKNKVCLTCKYCTSLVTDEKVKLCLRDMDECSMKLIPKEGTCKKWEKENE